MVAGPVPLVAPEKVIHESGVVAVQLQFGPVFTMKLPRPPRDATLPEAGTSAYTHGCGTTTVTRTGIPSSTFAAPGALSARTPECTPTASAAACASSVRFDGVVPAAADSVAPGMPSIATSK